MPLHPDLEAFLELAEMGRLSGKSKPMHEMTVAEARAEFERTSAILDPGPPGSVNVSTLSVPVREGAQIEARLYRGAGAAPNQRCILYFHGGGYVVGSLDSHDSICRRLAASGDFAVLAPAYRLAPERPFPTAVNDALDAANWLAEQGQALQLDTRSVVFAGDSVGATLATVLAITAVRLPSEIALKPAAQLLFYPVTDALTQRDSHRRHAEGLLLESATLEWFYSAYARAEERLDWRVSPLLMGKAEALAPAYIAVAEFDPLHDEGLEYARLLAGNGTSVNLEVVQGMTHDFLRMSGLVAEVAGIYSDVNEWLKAL